MYLPVPAAHIHSADYAGSRKDCIPSKQELSKPTSAKQAVFLLNNNSVAFAESYLLPDEVFHKTPHFFQLLFIRLLRLVEIHSFTFNCILGRACTGVSLRGLGLGMEISSKEPLPAKRSLYCCISFCRLHSAQAVEVPNLLRIFLRKECPVFVLPNRQAPVPTPAFPERPDHAWLSAFPA